MSQRRANGVDAANIALSLSTEGRMSEVSAMSSRPVDVMTAWRLKYCGGGGAA